MIKLKHLIDEGLSDIVYHYTNIHNLKSIVQHNKFHTSLALGSEADLNANSKKFYYMSTTRSKGTGYNIGNVCLVLDGRKLNQKYKGMPVDYWQHSKDPKDYYTMSQYFHYAFRSELEDRIILDNPYIENALSYIKEIHIYIDPVYKDKNLTNVEYIDSHIPAHIKLYFYNNEKYFRTQSINKSINLNSSMFDTGNNEINDLDDAISTPKMIIRRVGSIIAILSYQDDGNLHTIVDLFGPFETTTESTNTLEAVNYQIEYYNERFRLFDHEHHFMDFYTTLQNDLHYYRSNRSPIIRSILHLLAKDLKLHNCKNMKEYMNFKFGKSYKFG